MTVSLAPLSATDIAAIETTQLQFAAAFLRRDFDALAALYTDDAVVMPPNEPAVHGRTALKAWMAAFPVVTDFTLSTGRIEGRADLAYVRGTYTMTLRPEGGQTPVMVPREIPGNPPPPVERRVAARGRHVQFRPAMMAATVASLPES